jgi:hypothetical protein
MFFPGQVEKRDQAVVEEVQKIGQGPVFFPFPGQNHLGVPLGHHTGRSGQSQKSHFHGRRLPVFGRLQR